MIHHAFIIFSIFVSTAVLGEEATSPYQPTDVFLFNCGSTSDNVDENGRKWMLENQKILPSNSHNTSFSVDALYQDSGVPQVPYMNARIFQSDFTYSFPVSSGWKFIRLYFYPTNYGSKFDAVDSYFSVTVNRFIVLQNFSANLTARASKPESFWLIKEFIVPVNRTLNLTFKPSPNSLAFVNGIEIVSMPDRFYSKGGFDNLITNVDSNVIFFEINNSTALESVHRINVGGQLVPDVKDSGMFRRWLADDDFGNGGHVVRIPGVKINYTEKTPAYVAPEDVYATSRSMGTMNNDPSLNLKRNMTWFFTVDAGYTYLVRLHFCETLQEVTDPGQRIFSIFIGNQIASLETDVIQLSGGSRIPVYLDFSINMGSHNGGTSDLQLDLHPYKDANPKYYDVILNGVEILKLNDFRGSFLGLNPIPSISPDPLISPKLTPNRVPPSIGKGKLHVQVIILITVGSAIGLVTFTLVLMLSMRQMKKKNRKENSVAMFKVLLKQYTYAELKKITKSFSHIVGKGGFGTVYGGNFVMVVRLE